MIRRYKYYTHFCVSSETSTLGMAPPSISQPSKMGYRKLSNIRRRIDDLSEGDLMTHPVWQFVSDDYPDETFVEPVHQSDIPLHDLSGVIFCTKVRVANGKLLWSQIGSVDGESARANRHLLTISLLGPNGWLYVPRYHDIGYGRPMLSHIASMLDLRMTELFPIVYDLRKYAVGRADALVGAIENEPEEVLSKRDLLAFVRR
jgi:hypothetical protein